MNLGLMYALIVVAIVLVIVVAGSFVALEKSRQQLAAHNEELSMRLWLATRDHAADDEIVSDLARRLSAVERRLVGQHRRLNEVWKSHHSRS